MPRQIPQTSPRTGNGSAISSRDASLEPPNLGSPTPPLPHCQRDLKKSPSERSQPSVSKARGGMPVSTNRHPSPSQMRGPTKQQQRQQLPKQLQLKASQGASSHALSLSLNKGLCEEGLDLEMQGLRLEMQGLRDFLDTCVRESEDVKSSFRKQAIDLNATFHSEVDRRIGALKGSFESRVTELERRTSESGSSNSPQTSSYLAERIATLEEKFEQSMANLETDLCERQTGLAERLAHVELTTRSSQSVAATVTDIYGKQTDLAERVGNLEASTAKNGLCGTQWSQIEADLGRTSSQTASLTEIVDGLKRDLCNVQALASKAMNESESFHYRCSKLEENCSHADIPPPPSVTSPDIQRIEQLLDGLNRDLCHAQAIATKAMNESECVQNRCSKLEEMGSDTSIERIEQLLDDNLRYRGYEHRIEQLEKTYQDHVERALSKEGEGKDPTALHELQNCIRQLEEDRANLVDNVRFSHVEYLHENVLKRLGELEEASLTTEDVVVAQDVMKRLRHLEEDIIKRLSQVEAVQSQQDDILSGDFGMRFKQLEEASVLLQLKDKEDRSLQSDREALGEELRTNLQKDTKQYLADALADSFAARLAEFQNELRVEHSSSMSELVTNNNTNFKQMEEAHAQLQNQLMEELSNQLAYDAVCSAAAEEISESSHHAKQLCEELSAAMMSMDEVAIDNASADASLDSGQASSPCAQVGSPCLQPPHDFQMPMPPDAVPPKFPTNKDEEADPICPVSDRTYQHSDRTVLDSSQKALGATKQYLTPGMDTISTSAGPLRSRDALELRVPTDKINSQNAEARLDAVLSRCMSDKPASGSVVYTVSPRHTDTRLSPRQQSRDVKVATVPSARVAVTAPLDQPQTDMCSRTSSRTTSPRNRTSPSQQLRQAQPQPHPQLQLQPQQKQQQQQQLHQQAQPHVSQLQSKPTLQQQQQSKQQQQSSMTPPMPGSMPSQQLIARTMSPRRNLNSLGVPPSNVARSTSGSTVVQGGSTMVQGHSTPMLMTALSQASGSTVEIGRTTGPTWRSELARSPVRVRTNGSAYPN